jgi:hypothetical protein
VNAETAVLTRLKPWHAAQPTDTLCQKAAEVAASDTDRRYIQARRLLQTAGSVAAINPRSASVPAQRERLGGRSALA